VAFGGDPASPVSVFLGMTRSLNKKAPPDESAVRRGPPLARVPFGDSFNLFETANEQRDEEHSDLFLVEIVSVENFQSILCFI